MLPVGTSKLSSQPGENPSGVVFLAVGLQTVHGILPSFRPFLFYPAYAMAVPLRSSATEKQCHLLALEELSLGSGTSKTEEDSPMLSKQEPRTKTIQFKHKGLR